MTNEDFSPFVDEIKILRQKGFEKQRKRTRAISWTEQTWGIIGAAFSVCLIIPTRGCEWALSDSGGCSMCGYINDSTRIKGFEVLPQFKEEWYRYRSSEDIEIVKIFNSGSFFDESEIPKETQKAIFQMISENSNVREIAVESRPSYVIKNYEWLKELKETFPSITFVVGIGLETSNDEIRKNFINKGFMFDEYLQSVNILHSAGWKVKTYLLVKPPFLTEEQAIKDCRKSITAAIRAGTDLISLNPVAIHSNSYVEALWNRGLYQTTWLWSIVEILLHLDPLSDRIPILCDLVAPGKRKGPSNCGKCNERIIAEIQNFTLTQSFSPLLQFKIDCPCRIEWEKKIKIEKISGRIKPLIRKGWRKKVPLHISL